MGTRRIANVLCRAGLHLASTTVRRMLAQKGRTNRPAARATSTERRVTSRRPNHVWLTDLTTVPTMLGFWVPWLPFALPPIWPFCWWVAVAIDHFSRRIVGIAVFKKEPTSAAVQIFLARAIREAGTAPNHLITESPTAACSSQRKTSGAGVDDGRSGDGAVGKYGSISIIERFMRTLKQEGTRLILVPFRFATFHREVGLIVSWYNTARPHSSLGARTPEEVYFRQRPACRAPRFETRPRWPRRSPCAAPHALIRGRPGVVLDLNVTHRAGRKHLPLVQLKRVA